MKNKKADVLLTYGWVRSTYAALRNLSKHNAKVIVCDTNKYGMCQQSRLKEGFELYADPFSENEDKFVSDLIRIIEKHRIKVLLPSHDETEIIAKHREEFPNGVVIPIADYKQLSFANNKLLTADFAANLGISVPQKYSLSELVNDGAETRDYVVKLLRSNSAKGVFYAKDKLHALALVDKLKNEFELSSERLPLVQERVSGEGWGVSCLYWHGERIAHFTHKRLREKTTTGGTSTLRQAISNPFLEEMAYTLLDALHWHGLAMVEFKYDEKSNKGWFIEINPRLWGSIYLAIASGVEFPYLTYLCAIGQEAKAKRIAVESPIRQGTIARWYLGDLIIFAHRMLNREFAHSLSLLLPGNENSYDDVFTDDLQAFVGEMMFYLERFMKTHSFNPTEGANIG